MMISNRFLKLRMVRKWAVLSYIGVRCRDAQELRCNAAKRSGMCSAFLQGVRFANAQ
jgi:hypothetical protein